MHKSKTQMGQNIKYDLSFPHKHNALSGLSCLQEFSLDSTPLCRAMFSHSIRSQCAHVYFSESILLFQ